MGRRRVQRHRWLRALAAASLVAGAACGPSTDGAEHTDSIGRHGSGHTDVDVELLHSAEEQLVVACMRGRGFEYRVQPRKRIAESRFFPYVVDDLAWAGRHGYGSGLQRDLEAAVRADPNERHLAALPAERAAEWLRALNGTPTDTPFLEARLPTGGAVRASASSCTAEAAGRLYGDGRTWFRISHLTENLAGLRTGRVMADPLFTAATAAWSRCMRAAGHPYDSPGAARAAATDKRARGGFAAEVRTAVAEATCAHSSGLARTATDLDRRFDAELRGRFRAELAERRRLEDAALPRARAATHAG